jgi:putative tricarboxylic transport membrane protein
MLAGFMMWGIRPGPLLFTTKPDLVWGLIASMYVGNVILLLINIFLVPVFVAMLRVPYSVLMGFIIVFASIGAYSVNNSMFEVWLMLGFGLLGYAMKKLAYPVVPLILAMVLGNLFEKSLRQALVLSAGSFDVFYTRPIAAVFLLIALVAYCSPLIRMALKKAGYGKSVVNVESL